MGQTEKAPGAGENRASDPSRPGVMGDWTEEQNLGQPGDPKARIGKDEVEEAFGQEGEASAPQAGST